MDAMQLLGEYTVNSVSQKFWIYPIQPTSLITESERECWIYCMGTAEPDRSRQHAETMILKKHITNCVMLRVLDTDIAAVSWVVFQVTLVFCGLVQPSQVSAFSFFSNYYFSPLLGSLSEDIF